MGIRSTKANYIRTKLVTTGKDFDELGKNGGYGYPQFISRKVFINNSNFVIYGKVKFFCDVS